ncbi:MAG: GWxTD domain-containing protein, partial [Bacteroidota bacterium]
ATDRERRAIGDLASIDDKRQYLVAFWRKRDTDPTTAGNEGRQDFYSRLQYVKERYSTARREGWKTDRGRIVLKYGIPSNIDPKPYDRQLAPHEIWEYNNLPGQGRALFIFADMDGFNVYELLHTTVPGERQDPNWQTTLARRRR